MYFRNALEQSSQQHFLENDKTTHIVLPAWSAEEPCHFCHNLINCSTEPRNLTRTCRKAADITHDLILDWGRQQFCKIIEHVQLVIDCLS